MLLAARRLSPGLAPSNTSRLLLRAAAAKPLLRPHRRALATAMAHVEPVRDAIPVLLLLS